MKLNPNKCQLVLKEAHFCGRIVDAEGIRFNPRNYDALVSMPTPTKVGDLMQLVHGANWMRIAIPRFSELVVPLQDLLEKQYSLLGSRKKSRVFNRPLSAWGEKETTAFTCLLQAIAEQVKLRTPDP